MNRDRFRARTGQPEQADGSLDGGSANRLLAEGRTLAQFGDIEVLVLQTRRGIFAVENSCPHLGLQLSDAAVSGRNLICTAHHRRYNLDTGRPAGATACRTQRLRTFDATVVDGRLRLAPKRAM
jgi:nitrite reductase/ring-hydroxylating ferredoxin subunit